MTAADFLPGITGSFAQKAAENPTVAIVEAAYAQAGLHVRYLNCEVGPDDLGDAVRGAKAMGWLGFNCSLPHKVAVIEYLDALAPSASIIGAVNCVVNTGGRLIGENTDGKGFVEALLPVVSPVGARVVIFGAGGAARAIAVETALAGAAHLTIVNTTASRGEELTALINAKTPATAEFIHWDYTYAVPAATNIVINATSIGFHPDVDAQLNLDVDSLLPTMTVADVITNPPLTQLLKSAAARGCTTIDGLGMLVNQARVAITLWTGDEVATSVMRETLEQIFSSTNSTTG